MISINFYIFQLLYVTLFLIWFVDPSATIYSIVFGIGLSLLLKKIIQEPRPNNSSGNDDWGMPSTHSQTYMFLCIYLYFRGYTYHSFIVLLLWGITFYYKVKSGDHSIEQYVLGGIFGSIFASVLCGTLACIV